MCCGAINLILADRIPPSGCQVLEQQHVCRQEAANDTNVCFKHRDSNVLIHIKQLRHQPRRSMKLLRLRAHALCVFESLGNVQVVLR